MLTAPTKPANITLADGKERVLRYSLRAKKAIREKYGELLKSGRTVELFDDPEALAFVIAEGLRHNREGGDISITQEIVMDLIEMQAIPYAIQQVGIAWGASEEDIQAELDRRKNVRTQTPELPVTVN